MVKLIALFKSVFQYTKRYHTEYRFTSKQAIMGLRAYANPTEQTAISAVLAGTANKQECRVVAGMFKRYGQVNQYQGKVSC